MTKEKKKKKRKEFREKQYSDLFTIFNSSPPEAQRHGINSQHCSAGCGKLVPYFVSGRFQTFLFGF